MIENSKSEYAESNVKHKIIVCHNPFTYLQEPPFDIEREIYTEWSKLIGEQIKPDLMICGHVHKLFVSKSGSQWESIPQPCTVISGSDKKHDYHAGCGLIFPKEIKAAFYDSEGNITELEL